MYLYYYIRGAISTLTTYLLDDGSISKEIIIVGQPPSATSYIILGVHMMQMVPHAK